MQDFISGKDYDPRCPHYTKELKDKITELGVEEEISFLGFLDRNVLLTLIKNSAAVIQPSLFEGWSTVVEDAKALDKPIIASSLNVHHEQMGNQGIFFNPGDAEELANAMIKHLQSRVIEMNWDYSQRTKEFGEAFMKMISKVVQN